MKKLLYLFVLVALVFTSCKKEPKLHKIKFQITFLEIPNWASSNYIDVTAQPCYYGDYNNSVDEHGNLIQPYIDYDQTQDGLWEYEYWELKSGDKVKFSLSAQLHYWYELKVFIDDVEVSYKKVKISEYNYFEVIDLEESGWDDTPGDSYIDFTYYE
jgi:hypothetical protein